MRSNALLGCVFEIDGRFGRSYGLWPVGLGFIQTNRPDARCHTHRISKTRPNHQRTKKPAHLSGLEIRPELQASVPQPEQESRAQELAPALRRQEPA